MQAAANKLPLRDALTPNAFVHSRSILLVPPGAANTETELPTGKAKRSPLRNTGREPPEPDQTVFQFEFVSEALLSSINCNREPPFWVRTAASGEAAIFQLSPSSCHCARDSSPWASSTATPLTVFPWASELWMTATELTAGEEFTKVRSDCPTLTCPMAEIGLPSRVIVRSRLSV